jgi:DNA-directed RNA polymerase specialized sigma24 family protein
VSGWSKEDREDAEQEARLAVWRWIKANPTQQLGPGLTRILSINAARDLERASRYARGRSVDLTPGLTSDPWADGSTPDSYVSGADQAYEVELGDILSKIVFDEREAAVALHVIYEELTVREAAEVLGLPRQTVQNIMTRLRDRARELGVGV